MNMQSQHKQKRKRFWRQNKMKLKQSPAEVNNTSFFECFIHSFSKSFIDNTFCQHSKLLTVIRDRIRMSPVSAFQFIMHKLGKSCFFQSHKSCTNQIALYTHATQDQHIHVSNCSFDSLLNNKQQKGFVYALTRCFVDPTFHNLFHSLAFFFTVDKSLKLFLPSLISKGNIKLFPSIEILGNLCLSLKTRAQTKPKLADLRQTSASQGHFLSPRVE